MKKSEPPKAAKPRDHMEAAGAQMKRGVEHLAEHHREERRELERGHNRERGNEGKR